MSDHLEDDEQVEALKRWWDENGRSTLVAVALAIGGTVGWQQYQGWSETQQQDAADAWDRVQVQLQSPDPQQQAAGQELAEALKEAHGNTTYGQFAALQLAALAVEQEDLAEAESQLRWALAAGDTESELGKLIQLRLARVLAASGDQEGALTILANSNGKYAAAYATARGDIYLTTGRHSEALAAYQEARAASLELGNPPGLLEAKITSLESRLAGSESS